MELVTILLPFIIIPLFLSTADSYEDNTYKPDRLVYGSNPYNNLCYHRNGKARFCQPQFENLAPNKPVVATSTCGAKPERICHHNGEANICEFCDEKDPKLKHPAHYLTDYHAHGTCWMSEPLSRNLTSVNLTISFHKKHTVYYMSITGCGMDVPDALEVFKSADYGVSWQLWHLFSKNCSKDYNKKGYSYQFREAIEPREVICTDINQITNINDNRFPQQQPVLSFSTNFNRFSANGNYEKDPVIIDWMLATDMRVVLKRNPLKNGSVFSQPFAFSNLDIGGRCFCNGHASRCVTKDKKSTCECAHGTEGDDCERCKPFWVDLPWQRSTASQPTECKRCQCNSHATSCYFDVNAYRFSPEPKSAGVCLGCLHNTAGRNCQYCREGFHRNWNVLPDNVRMCTLCNCHPLGSATNICDRSNGRCTCKDGVEGDKCDRCKSGYVQTNDPGVPCRRNTDTWRLNPPQPPERKQPQQPTDVYQPAPAPGKNKKKNNKKNCPKRCKSNERKLSQADYCLRQWALSVTISSVKKQRRWMMVTAQVQEVFKCKNCLELPPRITFWIKRKHWRCSCPKLKVASTYLVITRDKRHRHNVGDLVLNRKTIVWPWEPALSMKIQRYKNFIGYYKDGCRDCNCVKKEYRARRQKRKNGKDRKKKKAGLLSTCSLFSQQTISLRVIRLQQLLWRHLTPFSLQHRQAHTLSMARVVISQAVQYPHSILVFIVGSIMYMYI